MPLDDELSQGFALEPIEHDPFVAAAPSSGNIMDPASQPVSPWTDSPLAKVGRLIGERGLAGAMPPRTIGAPTETMQDFWRRWPEVILSLTGRKAAAKDVTKPQVSSDQNSSYKLVPIDHNPFTGAP